MPSLRFAVPVILTLSSAVGCASAGPIWLPFERASLPSGTSDGSAIELDRELRVRFAIDDGQLVAEQTRVSRVLVLTEAGRKHAWSAQSYSPSFQSVVSGGARLIRPDDEIEEKSLAQMSDVLAVGGGVSYSDSRYLYSSFDAVPVGSVVEHHFATRHTQPELFTFWSTFGAEIPIARARFVVEVPPGFEIEHTTTRTWSEEAWAPEVVTRADGTRIYQWSARDLPAQADEVFAPSQQDLARIVSVRIRKWVLDGKVSEAFADMSAFGRWIHEIQGSSEPNADIRAVVHAVLADTPADPRAQAQALYAWVQENVRYVAVAIGIGGWAAHPAAEVLQNKYGDCKDKAMLLSAMLRVADIDSRLVILQAHDGVPRRQIFPAIGITNNHAILAVDLPDGTVFVDPTTRTTPFGELPPSDQGAPLLVVGAQSTEVVDSPIAAPGAHTRTVALTLSVPPSGDAKGQYRLAASGALADALDRQLMAARDDRQRSMRSMLGLPAGLVSDDMTSTASTSAGQRALVVTGSFTIPSPVQGGGSTHLLRLDSILASQLPALPAGERKTPLVFRGTEVRDWSIRVELPKGLVPSLPPPVSVDDEDLNYALSWSFEGRTLAANVRYLLKQRVYPKERYEALRTRFDEIAAAGSTPVILRTTHGAH